MAVDIASLTHCAGVDGRQAGRDSGGKRRWRVNLSATRFRPTRHGKGGRAAGQSVLSLADMTPFTQFCIGVEVYESASTVPCAPVELPRQLQLIAAGIVRILPLSNSRFIYIYTFVLFVYRFYDPTEDCPLETASCHRVAPAGPPVLNCGCMFVMIMWDI